MSDDHADDYDALEDRALLRTQGAGLLGRLALGELQAVVDALARREARRIAEGPPLRFTGAAPEPDDDTGTAAGGSPPLAIASPAPTPEAPATIAEPEPDDDDDDPPVPPPPPPIPPGPGVLLAIRPGDRMQVEDAQVDGFAEVVAVAVEGLRVRVDGSGDTFAIGWPAVLLDGINGHLRPVGPELTTAPPADDRQRSPAEEAHRLAGWASAAAVRTADTLAGLDGQAAPDDTAEARLALGLASRALLRFCSRLDDHARAAALLDAEAGDDDA